MVYLLATKRRAGTQAIMTDNATNQQRFTNMKAVFAQNNLYRLFAEPAEAPSEISWYTDWPVDESKPVRTLGELSINEPAHALEVKGKIASLMDAFYREAEKYKGNGQSYQRLRHILTDSFEIPEAESNVWIFTDTSGQERYVLTQWGHLRDEYNPRRGLINSWERVSRKNVSIRILWEDTQQPASGQTLTFTDSSGNRVGQFITDSDGQGLLNKVQLNFPVYYQQHRLDGLSINRGELLIDERDTYELMLLRLGDLTVRTKPGTTVLFEFDEKRETYTADNNGTIHLSALKGGTKIRAYQYVNDHESNEHTYRFNPDDPEVSFTAAEPTPVPQETVYDAITVELHSRKQLDNPLVGAEVVLGMAGRSETRVTNEQGVCALDAVSPGNIVVKVTHQGKRYEGAFVHKPGQSHYQLWVKPLRSLAWLWWFLGALLLLVLLCYWHFLPICPYCCDSNQEGAVSQRDTIIRRDTITQRDTIFQRDTVRVKDRILHRGDITVTLEWETPDDLDLFLQTPDGGSIHYGNTNKTYSSENNNMKGYLEIDANVNDRDIMLHPVEHIYCTNPIPGTYQVLINYYKKRTDRSQSLPYTVKIQVGDSVYNYNGDRSNFTGIGEQAEKLLVKEFTYP